MPNEADVGGEVAEIRNRGARVRDVLPHRILWAAMRNRDVAKCSRRLQLRQKLAVVRGEHGFGPVAGHTGIRVEVRQVGLADRAPIVIPGQRPEGQLAQALDDLVRRWPIANQIAQAPDQDRQERAPRFSAPKAALAPLCAGLPGVHARPHVADTVVLPSAAAVRVEVEPCSAIPGRLSSG